MTQPLAKSDIPWIWNFFLLPRLCYLAQFVGPTKQLLRHLALSLKRLYRVAPTFPGLLITFSDWLLELKMGPYDAEAWLASVMLRAVEQFVPDRELANALGGCSYARGSIDWQQNQLHSRWASLQTPFHYLRNRVQAISYGLGRLPVFDRLQTFDGLLWRLYTDGGCKGASVSSAAVLYLGAVEVFRVWGNVQFDPKGQNWKGARHASSTTGEIAAPLLFVQVVTQLGLWTRAQGNNACWPTKHLLMCIDSSSAVKVLSGSAVGSAEPALSAVTVDTMRSFAADCDISIGAQQIPSHIVIPGNVVADELATLGLDLEPGTYKYLHTSSILSENSTFHLLNTAVGLSRLNEWPAERLVVPTRHGAQSTAYSHWKGRLWLTGRVHATLRKRLLKWWGVSYTCSWFSALMLQLRNAAPRLKWCLFSALLGEWPTGQRLRHILAPGSACPVCRFCGAHTDSVKHWFGPLPCSVLWMQLQRSLPLPSIPRDGWFSAGIGDSVWTSILSAVYSVHCQLRWGRNDSAISNIVLLREGVWLSQAQNSCACTLETDTVLARKKAARRQSKLRSRQKKALLRSSIQTCALCGQVYSGEHLACSGHN